MAAPAYVASSTALAELDTSIALTLPAGINADDLILVHYFHNAGLAAATLNVPTGSGAGTYTRSGLGSTEPAGNMTSDWFWKRADGTEDSTTLTCTKSAGILLFVCVAHVFSGVITTGTPYEAESDSGGAGAAVASDAMTLGGDDRLICVLYCDDDDDTADLPILTGSNVTFTERFQFTTATGLDGAVQLQTAPNGAGVTSITAGSYTQASADNWALRQFALLPVPSAPSISAMSMADSGRIWS